MNIKKAVLVLFRLCISRDYRRLRRLKVFDSGYYLSLQQKSSGDDLDPLWTYVNTGESCAKRMAGGTAAWSQQADPHPLFDTSYYVSRYWPDGLKENPLINYLRSGWKKGYRPGPFFDPVIYGERCGWNPGYGDPLTYYTHHGQQQGESPSLNFDFQYYFDKNPVLAGVRYEIIKHYKLHGASIGKSPLPVFDPRFYLEQCGGENGVISDPLSHYISTADSTTHLPGKLFDPDFYIHECGVKLTRGEALTHYVTQGVFAGLYCHPRVASLSSMPLISIVVPVYNPDPAVLRNCIRSVLYQAYPHWELCLVDDCSPHGDVRPLLEEWAAKDSRIKVTFLPDNRGIAGATNSAVELASGSYLGFLDNDDELTVDCLLEVVEAINSQNAELVYSDEDLIGDDGTTLSVFRKPDFNPGLLLSHNYITHFVTVKKSLFEEVGGLDSLYDGAQDFDLMLKLTEVCENIVHIQKVLYHWRASESSTSINHEQKDYANEAGRQALQAAVVRRGFPYEVAATELNFFYRLLGSPCPVAGCTVFIWAANQDELKPEFIASLGRGGTGVGADYILIVREQDRGKIILSIEGSSLSSCKVVSLKEGETKAVSLHRLISQVDRDFVVIVDGGFKNLNENWLMELYSPFCQMDVAMVCGRTTYNGGDGTSHLLADTTNKSAVYYQEYLSAHTCHMAGLHSPQDVSYGGWDLTMFRRDVYELVGGFCVEQFPELFAMAELSLRFRDREKNITYTPFACGDKEAESVWNHQEESREIHEEKQRFQTVLRQRDVTVDPFYNGGLLVDQGVEETVYRRWLRGE